MVYTHQGTGAHDACHSGEYAVMISQHYAVPDYSQLFITYTAYFTLLSDKIIRPGEFAICVSVSIHGLSY